MITSSQQLSVILTITEESRGCNTVLIDEPIVEEQATILEIKIEVHRRVIASE